MDNIWFMQNLKYQTFLAASGCDRTGCFIHNQARWTREIVEIWAVYESSVTMLFISIIWQALFPILLRLMLLVYGSFQMVSMSIYFQTVCLFTSKQSVSLLTSKQYVYLLFIFLYRQWQKRICPKMHSMLLWFLKDKNVCIK